MEADGMELVVGAAETIWGTHGIHLKPGDFVEVKINHLDKQQKKLKFSIREANDAWAEVYQQVDDATIYRVCDDGLIVEHQGSLGFVDKEALVWWRIQNASDILMTFRKGEQVKVFKTGQGKKVQLSLKSRQMQLSTLREGALVPKAKACVKSKVDDGIYVSVEGLIGFAPRERIAMALYKRLKKNMPVELELIKMDRNAKIAEFRIIHKEESLPVVVDQSQYLFNFNNNYSSRIRSIISKISGRSQSEEKTNTFDGIFEEIRNKEIISTYLNLKTFLDSLNNRNLLDEFLDSTSDYDEAESNDFLKRLLAGAKLYRSESVEVFPDSCAEDCFIAGYICYLKGQTSRSLGYWSEAYKRDSNSLDITLAYADACRQCQRDDLYEMLIDRYFHAISLRNLLKLPEIYVPSNIKKQNDFEYAEAQFNLRDVGKALSRFNVILQNSPKDVKEAALLNRALCHTVLGLYHQADADLKQIGTRSHSEPMSFNPYLDAYYQIALQVRFHLGDLDAFRNTLRSYINQCDSHPNAAMWLGYILAKEGYYDVAYSVMEKSGDISEAAALKQFLGRNIQKELPLDQQDLLIHASHRMDNTQFIRWLPQMDPNKPEQCFQTCVGEGALEALEPMWQKHQLATPEVEIEYIKFRAKTEELMGRIDKAAEDLNLLASKVIPSNLSEPEKLRMLEVVLQFMADYSLHAEIKNLSKNQPIQDFCAIHSAQSLFDKYSRDKPAPTAIISRLRNYWEGLKKNPNGSHKVAGYAQNLCSHPRIKEILASEEGQPLREFLSQMSIRNPEFDTTQ